MILIFTCSGEVESFGDLSVLIFLNLGNLNDKPLVSYFKIKYLGDSVRQSHSTSQTSDSFSHTSGLRAFEML